MLLMAHRGRAVEAERALEKRHERREAELLREAAQPREVHAGVIDRRRRSVGMIQVHDLRARGL